MLLDLCLEVLKVSKPIDYRYVCVLHKPFVSRPQCELRLLTSPSVSSAQCSPGAPRFLEHAVLFPDPPHLIFPEVFSLSPIQENQQKLRQLCCEAPLFAHHMKDNRTWNETLFQSSFSHRAVKSRSYHLVIIQLITFIFCVIIFSLFGGQSLYFFRLWLRSYNTSGYKKVSEDILKLNSVHVLHVTILHF